MKKLLLAFPLLIAACDSEKGAKAEVKGKNTLKPAVKITGIPDIKVLKIKLRRGEIIQVTEASDLEKFSHLIESDKKRPGPAPVIAASDKIHSVSIGNNTYSLSKGKLIDSSGNSLPSRIELSHFLNQIVNHYRNNKEFFKKAQIKHIDSMLILKQGDDPIVFTDTASLQSLKQFLNTSLTKEQHLSYIDFHRATTTADTVIDLHINGELSARLDYFSHKNYIRMKLHGYYLVLDDEQGQLANHLKQLDPQKALSIPQWLQRQKNSK